MNNYETARLKACKEFKRYDIEEVIRSNDLKYDDEWIFLRYLYKDYRISKQSGVVYCNEKEASFSETLSVFDLLCHRGEKCISGDFAGVNSLNNGPVSSGVPMDNFGKFADFIDANQEKYISFCTGIGAKRVEGGDICFEFEIFKDLRSRIKFYASDDEFPASAALLFEKNMLMYVNYETVFYIAGDLTRLVEENL